MRACSSFVLWLCLLATAPAAQIVLRSGDTASLRGRVIARDTGQSIPGCRVVATPRSRTADAGPPRIRPHELFAITGPDGRYAFDTLPSGVYRLRAEVPSKQAGYLSAQFGADSPDTVGRPVRLAPNDRATADFALRPAATISGRLLDDRGRPVVGATVMLASDRLDNQGQPRTIVSKRTGPDGRYTVDRLAPGTYRIQAQAPVVPDEQGRALAPTYFRATPESDLAEPITIVSGQHADGVDVTFAREPVLTLRGHVYGEDGGPAAGAHVRIAFRVVTAIRYRDVRADEQGAFVIPRVFAGEYMLTAGAGTPVGELAMRSIDLPADATADLHLAAGATLEGHVVFDGGGFDGPPLQIESLPADRMEAVLTPAARATVQPDQRFSLGGQFGPRLLRVAGLPPDWWMEAVRIGSQDITNVPTVFPPGATSSVEIVVARRRVVLSGSVDLRGGSDAVVLAIPDDPSFWVRGSSAMATAWPAPDGSFQISALPAGRYRVIAADKPPRGFVELQRDALEWLWRNGTSVVIGGDQPANVRLPLTHLP
ncbi:MAG TPA: carboxypeptidase-like regulatory domain-containing protein [Vicinamibacterales bacterium]|nr:carboxypeptidase-like regulatory domain-containing protein [Vicinamibacterales bacterium]